VAFLAPRVAIRALLLTLSLMVVSPSLAETPETPFSEVTSMPLHLEC